MSWTARLLAAGICCGLAGCATSADPHEGVFVSGVVGLAVGGWQRRVDESRSAHQGELGTQHRLKAQARAQEEQPAQVPGDLARARSRVAAEERRIADECACSKVQGSGSATQASLAKLDQAQARVVVAKEQLQGVAQKSSSQGNPEGARRDRQHGQRGIGDPLLAKAGCATAGRPRYVSPARDVRIRPRARLSARRL